MGDAEEHRRKSEGYLRRAAQTEDLNERGRLLALAAYWNNQALEAETAERQRRRNGR